MPVDLIVPMAIAPSAGRRSARLGGEHGKRRAQKSRCLEGAVDASPIQIAALDAGDTRSLAINVAGEAALLVAKLHKLGDRLDEPRRLDAKDAGDVYRLFDSLSADAMADRIRLILNDARSAEVATAALRYGDNPLRIAGIDGRHARRRSTPRRHARGHGHSRVDGLLAEPPV